MVSLKYYNKRVLYITCLVFLLVINFLYISQKVRNYPYDKDEISWFFHTVLFEKLFVIHDIKNPVWHDFASYDHPPVVKYIYGAFLYLTDNRIFAKRSRLEQKWGRWEFYNNEKLNPVETSEFAPVIKQLRTLNTFILTLLIILLIFVVTKLTRNIVYGLLLDIFLVNNILFLSSLVRATSDLYSILFLTAALIYYLLFLNHKKTKFIILFGIFAGLSLSSKLSGVAILPGYYIIEAITGLPDKKVIFVSLKRIVIVTICVLSVWVLLNPALYASPVNDSFKYVQLRLNQFYVFQNIYSDTALFTFRERLNAINCVFFNTGCGNKFVNGHIFPNSLLNYFTFIISLILIFSKSRSRIDYLFIFLLVLTSYSLSLLFLQVNANQYYLLMLVVSNLVVFSGCSELAGYMFGIIKRQIKTPPMTGF